MRHFFAALIGILFLGFSGHCLLATTESFFPERGFLFPSAIAPYDVRWQIGSVFLNPAGIAGATRHQFQFDAMQNYFGYNHLSTAYVCPLWRGVLAAGYYTMYTQDIYRTSQATVTERPQILGQFGESFQQLRLGYAMALDPEWDLGVATTYYLRQLDHDSARFFRMDFGATWRPDNSYWIGAYTQNLLHTAYAWSDSGVTEALYPKLILDGGYRFHSLTARVSTNFNDFNLGGDWHMNEFFSVMADMLYMGGTMKRMGYGALIEFSSCLIQYQHLKFFGTGLDSDLDMIGLALQFDIGALR